MNFIFSRILLVLSLVAATWGGVAFAEDAVPSTYLHSGPKYPPILFVSNIKDEDFKKKLKEYNAFAQIDEKSIGIPIGVRVLQGLQTKSNSATFSTSLLAASTLGLMPIVNNKRFNVFYDVFVQGKSIANFRYQLDFTDVDHMWLGPNQDDQITSDEELFLEHSLSLFLNDIKNHKEIQAVFSEYREYFGDAQ